jgi:hypothetical protein
VVLGSASATGDVTIPELLLRKGAIMSVILVFVVFVLVGDAAAVGISSLVERFSESASLLVFFALFVLVFWVGWLLAVRVTERFFVEQN